jgi:hypothetical protein
MLRYLTNDREMVSVVPVINGITFVFTFQIHSIYVVRSLYFKIFPLFISCLYFLKFQFLLTDMFVSHFLLSEKVLSVCTFSFHNMASLLALIVSTGIVHSRTTVPCVILPLMLACVKVHLRKHSIMSLYIFSFWQYLALG